MADSPVQSKSYQTQIAYRRDIDGLRAWAVLPVVLFHAKIWPFTGGFTGVDVFFVISGYLITGIVLKDIERGSFSFIHFYRRRIKRLLPAYAGVALFVAVVSFLIMLPDDLSTVGKSLLTSGLFASNIFFYHDAGYFENTSEINPLLHTWSLAVEEQFYFIFPALLLISWRFFKRAPIIMSAVILVASFIASVWLTREDPAFAFYLLPTRAWELMAGAMLALAPGAFARLKGQQWLVFAGLAGILAATLFFNAETAFPGAAASLPVVATVLVIAAGGTGDRVSRLLLENSFAVFIGRISYSLYLWHWPLFALYLYYFGEHAGLLHAAGLILISVALAWLSYVYVEGRARSPNHFMGWKPFIFAAFLSGALVATGFALWYLKGVPQRLPEGLQTMLEERHGPRRGGCLASTNGWRDPSEACVYGADTAPRTAIWGDSHARMIMQRLGGALEDRGESATLVGYAGCPPAPHFSFDERNFRCAEFTSKALDLLSQPDGVETVVIFARHGVYAQGLTHDLGPAETGRTFRTVIPDPVEGAANSPRQDAYLDRLEIGVRHLREAGKNVVIVAPVPEVGYDVPRTVGMRIMRGESADFVRPLSAYYQRHGELLEGLDSIAEETGAVVLPMVDLFCDEEECDTVRDGKLLYYDNNHITPYAAEWVAQRVLDQVDAVAASN